MKKTAFLKSVGWGVILALLQTVSVSLADTVYDNSTTDLNIRFNPETREVGDEMILGGGARILTDFTFQYWRANFFGNDEQARLRFYYNDGPLAQASQLGNEIREPGTIFFDSDWFNVSQTDRSTLIFTDFVTGAAVPLSTLLPGSFTWTVKFRGVDSLDGESAGLDLYSPPTVGGNFDEIWVNTGPGGWEYRGTNSVQLSFAARIGAVPEPSVISLGLVGGLAALVLASRFRNN